MFEQGMRQPLRNWGLADWTPILPPFRRKGLSHLHQIEAGEFIQVGRLAGEDYADAKRRTTARYFPAQTWHMYSQGGTSVGAGVDVSF
jgi:hypothetical protein